MLSKELQQQQQQTYNDSLTSMDPLKLMHVHKHCLLTLIHMIGYNSSNSSRSIGSNTITGGNCTHDNNTNDNNTNDNNMLIVTSIFKYLYIKLPKFDAVSGCVINNK